jgi:transposase
LLSLAGTSRIFLCRSGVDFRKAHDGLCGLVRDQFREDPFSGDLFVFFNKARDRIKLLLWDRNGFWLLYKRLEKGRFQFDIRGEGSRIEIQRAQLSMILEGIDWKSAKISSHFSTSLAIKGRDESRRRTPS